MHINNQKGKICQQRQRENRSAVLLTPSCLLRHKTRFSDFSPDARVPLYNYTICEREDHFCCEILSKIICFTKCGYFCHRCSLLIRRKTHFRSRQDHFWALVGLISSLDVFFQLSPFLCDVLNEIYSYSASISS